MGVPLEDLADDRRGGRIDRRPDDAIELAVAEGIGADRPAAELGFALHADVDALDDARPLELGEDAEHLHHHPARRSRGFERLGRRAEGDPGLVQLLDQGGKLADAARQPIDLMDEQEIELLARCRSPERGKVRARQRLG